MHDGRFAVKMVSGVPVVMAPEEIDITIVPELRSALEEAASHGPGPLVVDMTQTQFCDSSGLHTLLAALTGIDRMIPNFATLDEAVGQASVDGSSSQPVTG
jgi:anti-anti-sigma factor